MTTKIGVVMDPITSINPKKDSTLAMMVAAQAKGWELRYMEQADLYARNGEIWARQHKIEVSDDLDSWFNLKDEVVSPLADLDVVLMRKDPPFDMEYVYSTYLLEMAEKQGVWVINKPQSIRDCNEKMFALQFPQCCPPHMVTRDGGRLRAFHEEHEDVIFKPLDGMGGDSIFRLKPGDPNLSVIIETLTAHGQRQIMAQKYIPEIIEGDKRILLINGKPVPYALARIPAVGETRGNLAAGGEGVGKPLTERDQWICDQVRPVLIEKGLDFVGIDVIGDYLTEINVTCPTCIRELNRAFNLDIAGDYMNYIESRIN